MKRLLSLVPDRRLLACPFTHSGSSARSRVLVLAERRTSMLVRMLGSQVPNSAFQRTGQQRRFACCWPAAEGERSASWIVARNVSAKMAARDPSP